MYARGKLEAGPAIIIGAIIIGVGLYLGLSGGGASPSPMANSGRADVNVGDIPQLDVEFDTDEHYRGGSGARFVIVEWSDIDCAFCQRVHPTLIDLSEDRDDVTWAYRHFPLDSAHPFARDKAEASECVARIAGNDAFWTYLDAMFEGDSIAEAATLAGVSEPALNSCLEDEAIAEAVQNDVERGLELGVRGTPFNLVYDTETGRGIGLPGAQPREVFEEVLAALEEAA